ncbi:uncharacterized protein METZ01_LOCUS108048 [marine metagenome]|uniref:Uncharacterized protein n=1 Tax=marine metagenome TaxID=408172 RepID=A0A381WRS3_9ZZZZ
MEPSIAGLSKKAKEQGISVAFEHFLSVHIVNGSERKW